MKGGAKRTAEAARFYALRPPRDSAEGVAFAAERTAGVAAIEQERVKREKTFRAMRGFLQRFPSARIFSQAEGPSFRKVVAPPPIEDTKDVCGTLCFFRVRIGKRALKKSRFGALTQNGAILFLPEKHAVLLNGSGKKDR